MVEITPFTTVEHIEFGRGLTSPKIGQFTV